mgnify:FL=1
MQIYNAFEVLGIYNYNDLNRGKKSCKNNLSCPPCGVKTNPKNYSTTVVVHKET